MLKEAEINTKKLKRAEPEQTATIWRGCKDVEDSSIPFSMRITWLEIQISQKVQTAEGLKVLKELNVWYELYNITKIYSLNTF